jgi:hypothetical protein
MAGEIERQLIHDDINLIAFVIPGLTRNPVFSWIPAFAGLTTFAGINVAVYSSFTGSDGRQYEGKKARGPGLRFLRRQNRKKRSKPRERFA